MTAVIIGCLVAAVIYLAKRWSGSKAENAQLKTQIISLKRRLTRHGRMG